MRTAAEYRESVIAPYRGKLPESVLANMEEQLSGSCTVEIAAFNEFFNFITNKDLAQKYDHILFDTAPTGHTLIMLQLPSAWSNFISESTHGASCLGQLSGLESKKEMYKMAVETLADGTQTTLILVTRPEAAPLREIERASHELAELGVCNQSMVINGVLAGYDDTIPESLYDKQQKALVIMPKSLEEIQAYMIPLRAYNITGIENVRSLLTKDSYVISDETIKAKSFLQLKDVIDDLYHSGKKVIFTMGKGGVGKTTLAAAIALGLSEKGEKVHLTTTDPAAHLKFVLDENSGITMSHIDEHAELARYQKEVERAENEVVVIDTALTGHTLLLLDSTLSYHKEVQRTQGNIPDSVKKLLPRLRSAETEVIIVTLPEATPVYEALRLEEDLNRANIATKSWLVNSSLYHTKATNALLAAKPVKKFRGSTG